MMRAAIYARVSSASQRDAHTIESQLRDLPAYVAAQGWELVDTYIDDGRSAKTGMLDERRSFARLQRDAELGRFNVLVVVDVDRLTRSSMIEERARILGPFQRLGIQIATPAGGLQDLGSFFGELHVTLKAIFAAEDNRLKASRIKAGKLSSAMRGGKATGWTPFGLAYDKPTNTWSIHPAHGKIVLEIFERAAAGESCIAIACDLVNRGAPGNGRAWSKHNVRNLLRATYPIGDWISHRATRTTVTVPALVDLELWSRAQAALTTNRKLGLVRTRRIYLLDHLGVCGVCGAKMRMLTDCMAGGRWHRPARYVCNNRAPTTPVALRTKDFVRCSSEPVSVTEADELAWSTICAEIEDPELPAEIVRDRGAIAANAHDWMHDAAGHRSHLARLDKVEASVLARFRRGAIGETALDIELVALRRERAAVRAQLTTAERAAGQVKSAQAQRGEAVELVESMRARMRVATPEERREIAHALIKPGGVVFVDGEIRISMVVDRAATSTEAIAANQPSSTCHDFSLRIRVVAK